MVQAALAASQRELNMVRAELQEAVQRQPLTLPLSTGAQTACCVAGCLLARSGAGKMVRQGWCSV